MEQYQKEFIEFAIEKQVLRFGEFKLKSGRMSPYFFNSGLFNDGKSLSELGKYYAEAVKQSGLNFDMIYGPAYKGIPLASAMAIAFQQQHQISYPFCFNRKEIKDHGEGGITFGSDINGEVLIIDDVISAGTSVRESIDIITNNGGNPAGVVIALDRQECGLGDKSAIQEVEQAHNIEVISIIKLEQIIDFLEENREMQANLTAIYEYRDKYGAATP